MELPGLDDLEQQYGRERIGQLHDPRKFLMGDEGDTDYTGMALGLLGGGGGRRRNRGGGGGGGPLMQRLQNLQGSDMEVLYGPNVAGHAGHLHLAAQQGLGKVLKNLQKKGFAIGEHPKYGGVGGGHVQGSHHYSGNAADINYYGGGRWETEEQALRWLKRKLKKALGDQAYYG